jgi:hypothetical protein
MVGRQRDQAAEWFRDLFASDWTKLFLSMLIILSVLPFTWVATYGLVFFAIFAVELYGRLLVLINDFRDREINRVELVFFALDVIATLSFLPIEMLWDDIRFLRFFRLSRMLLLLGYWGPIVREIWTILAKRERRYQLFFAGVSVLILAFLSAVLLSHFHARNIDFNEDGNLANDQFWAMLWWSFRQIQDPGNLVKDADASLGFFCSLLLTLAGLFIFSFIIGIATSVVEELVKMGRERRLGVREHSVICNLGPYSRVLLEELVTYYAKSLRSPRIVTLGPTASRFPYMYESALAAIRYRQGQATNAHDLQKVDADRATRVILLGQRDREESDSEVVSQVLSVREVNPECSIYAELFRGDNMLAALKAGGPATVPILADRLVALLVANIVAFPGLETIFGELLTSRGDEIYTCLYDRGALAGRKPPSGPLLPFAELMERAHRAHGVILLGFLVADDQRPCGYAHRLFPSQSAPVPPSILRGFFGVSTSFERLKDFVLSLPDVAAPSRSPETATAAVPSFGVCPITARISRLLICGFHDSLVDFCEQMILFTRELNIDLMVPEERDRRRVLEAFFDRPQDGLAQVAGQRVEFSRGDRPHELRYAVAGSERTGAIRLLLGDWSNERTMLGDAASGHALGEIDAVLFTYTLGETDPDARTALGLLKLLHIKESRPGLVKPHLRVVCEVQSAEKAKLLSRRFSDDRQAAQLGCKSVSIVPAESMRNAIVAQGVFVPGITPIYRELLSAAGPEIAKLLVTRATDPQAVINFRQLLTTLYHRDGVIPLAVELEQPDGSHRLVLNPRRGGEDHRFRVGAITSVYAVGEHTDLPRASRTCPGCCAAPDDEDGD